MRVVLEIVGGEFHGRKVLVRAGTALVVGRTTVADFSVACDALLSGRHFEVRVDKQAGTVTVKDLGSSNGTSVNGERIEKEQQLQDGDEINAGETRFKAQIEGAILASAPVSSGASQSPALDPADDAPAAASPSPQAVEARLKRNDSRGQQAPSALVHIKSRFTDNEKLMIKLGQKFSIGGSEMSDICVPGDAGLAAVHFSLEVSEQGCLCRDLGSQTGTFVNGVATTFQRIFDGDLVTAGESSFQLQVFGDGTPSPVVKTQIGAPSTNRPVTTKPAARSTRFTGAVPDTSSRPYQTALEDDDPIVYRAAIWAAAWGRQPWLLDYCRRIAHFPCQENWEAIRVLAVLGTVEDLPLITEIANDAALGHRRFEVIGLYGHPALVPLTLEHMASEDPLVAVAAGKAFVKMTGLDVESEDRVTLPPEDGSEPDEFELEFLDEVKMPDPIVAGKKWTEVASDLGSATRLCRGFKLNDNGHIFLDQLELESRWETSLRERYHTRPSYKIAQLLRFRASRSGPSGTGAGK